MNVPDSAEAALHAPTGEVEHSHPTWSIYWKVATILTIITIAATRVSRVAAQGAVSNPQDSDVKHAAARAGRVTADGAIR